MKTRLIIAEFLLCLFIFPLTAAEKPSRIVKIPLYEHDALYQKSANDNESSYVSEFLEDINRYSDFEFQYVPVERSELVSELKSGRIDMVPFMGREADTHSELLLSDIPTAIGSTVFASSRMIDFHDIKNLRVGILSFAPENLREKVSFYARNQGLSITFVTYDKTEMLIDDVKSGKLDVFASVDFAIPDDFFVAATIENTFFYLASAQKNQELFDEVNASLSTIFLLNPNFLSLLRSRYIPSARYSINKLSPKEQAFVKNHNNLRVAALMNQAPYTSLVDGKFQGIIIDLINEIAASSNFTVTYVPAYSYIEAMNLVKWGEADILYSVNEFMSKSDLASLKPTSLLLSQKYILVANSNLKKEEDAVFVSIRGGQYSSEYINSHLSVAATVYVDTSDECFALIEKNQNYFTFMPSQQAEYYIQNHLLTNVEVYSEGYNTSVSLGISRRLESEVAGVLDKAIYALTTTMFESFMERNMDTNLTIAAFIKKHLLTVSILIAIFVLVLASAIFLFVIIQTKRRKDREIKQAMNLANRDSMTGLFNHIAFEKKVNGILLHQQENEIGVFVMIDIDNFKKVNDTLGHAKGDYVIVSVANILISTFRGGDLKGRMGGDEFAVFMRNVSDIDAVARKMKVFQDTIRDYFEDVKLEIKVTCSIGISYCKGKQDENAFQRIYNAADEGLYQVKKSGKNAFAIVEMKEEAAPESGES